MRQAIKTRNFHVPLTAETYALFRQAAESLHQPATQIAREIIEAWVKKRQKELLHRQLAAYVKAHAGSSQDIDQGLEAAGIEHLRNLEDTHQSVTKKPKKMS